MTEHSHSDICKKCGGYCCTHSGTLATKLEVNEIIKAGCSNKFIKLSENCYITDFGEDLICPYLKESACEIYHVRPLLCKKYPIFSTDGEEHYLMHCPLTQYLSNDDIAKCIEAALSVPEDLFTAANNYLEPYASRLDELVWKFKKERIELD